jgi:NADPH:quinone reductase-like Zn-dependent oxidoreductase
VKAIVFDRFGDPAEVLQVRDVPLPEPGRGQVRVRMLASPVNPSDLLTVRGQYGRLPKLPATPGFEGAGVIDAAGPGLVRHLRGLKPGRRVAVLNSTGGNWQEQVIISARHAVPVPAELTDEQAATFFVNPATAVVMTRHVLRVPAGAWLLQTAAGSALGRMVIRLGKRDRFRTINVVRRRAQAEELLRLGGDAVICTEDESLTERVQALTQGAGVPFALDAVGGTVGSEAVQSLGDGGRMLVYGTLSEQPLTFSPRVLMVGHKRVEGFWLSEWAQRQRILTMLRLFRQVGGLLRDGVLTTEVGATYPMDRVRQAVQQAATPGRHGKVLLRISAAAPPVTAPSL